MCQYNSEISAAGESAAESDAPAARSWICDYAGPTPPRHAETDESHIVAVLRAASPGSFQKKFRYANPDRPDGIWRSEIEFRESPHDTWEKEDFPFPRRHFYEERVVSNHLSYAALLAELAQSPDATIALGRLKPSRRGEATISASQTANYDDVASSWLALDFDGVGCGQVCKDEDLIDICESRDDFEAFCDRLIDRALPGEFQDRTYIAVLTSSTGFRGMSRVYLRLFFRLSRPLTLDKQGALAERLNLFMQERGLARSLDTSIYARGRLLFTALPLAYVDFVKDENPRRGYFRCGSHFRGPLVVERDEDDAEIGDEYFRTRRGRAARGNGPRLTAEHDSKEPRTGGPEFFLRKLKDTRVNHYMSRAVASYCSLTPTAEWSADAFLALALKWAGMNGLSIDKDSQRATYFTIDWVEREFERCAKKGFVKDQSPLGREVPPPPAEAELPISEVREQLKAVGRRFVEAESEKGGGGTTPVDLVRAPPGAGKTHAYRAVLTPELLETERILWLSPAKKLSTENINRVREQFKAQETGLAPARIEALTRHHVGRKDLCKNKKFGKLAALVEKAGGSPLDKVCAFCPLRDTCKFPAQSNDTGPGLIGLQHAHATTSLQRLKPDSEKTPDRIVVDEGILNTLLNAKKGETECRVESLKPRKGFDVIKSRRRSGSQAQTREVTRIWDTNDFRAGRHELRRVLHRADGRIQRRQLGWFDESVLIEQRPGEKVYRRRSRLAVQAERRYCDGLVSEFASLIRKDAQGREHRNATDNRDRLQTLAREIRLSRLVVNIFRAIDATLEIPARKDVLGLLCHDRNGGRWVRCHIRKDLPPIMKTTQSAWLDGTVNPVLFRSMFHGANVEIKEHHWPVRPGAYHLTQYADKAFSKRMLMEAKGAKADATIRELQRFILKKAYEYRRINRGHACTVGGAKKDVLVVCQKEARRRLEQMDFPSNVAFEHLNHLRGIDIYRDIPCAVVIGRAEPRADVAEQLAEAWFFDNPNVTSITRLADWRIKNGEKAVYRGKRIVPMLGGPAREIDCEAHPDARVEMMRDQLVNSEVRQAVHRLRVHDRTEANSAEIVVFGDIAIGLPVHELRRWEDAKTSIADVMAASGVVFHDEASARVAHPGLIAGLSGRTARRLVPGPGSGAIWPNPNIRYSIKGFGQIDPPNWRTVEFRLCENTVDGRRSYVRTADVDCACNSDPGQAIASALGAAVEWRFATDARDGPWVTAQPAAAVDAASPTGRRSAAARRHRGIAPGNQRKRP